MIHSRCSPGTVQTTVPANAWVEYDVTTLLNSGDADYLRDLDEALRRRVVELCRELLGAS